MGEQREEEQVEDREEQREEQREEHNERKAPQKPRKMRESVFTAKSEMDGVAHSTLTASQKHPSAGRQKHYLVEQTQNICLQNEQVMRS